jgi:hypothetical protein
MISRYSGDNNLLQAVQNILKRSVPVHVCSVVILLPEITSRNTTFRAKALRQEL